MEQTPVLQQQQQADQPAMTLESDKAATNSEDGARRIALARAMNQLAVNMMQRANAFVCSSSGATLSDVAPAGSPLHNELVDLLRGNPALCAMLGDYVACASPPSPPTSDDIDKGVAAPHATHKSVPFFDGACNRASDTGDAYVTLVQFAELLRALPPRLKLTRGHDINLTRLSFSRQGNTMSQSGSHVRQIICNSVLDGARPCDAKTETLGATVREKLDGAEPFNCVDIEGTGVRVGDLLEVVSAILEHDNGVHVHDAVRFGSCRILHDAMLDIGKSTLNPQFTRTRFNPLYAIEASSTSPSASSGAVGHPDSAHQIDAAVAFAIQCVAFGMDTSSVLDALSGSLPTTNCHKVHLIRMDRRLFTYDEACRQMGGADVLRLMRGIFKDAKPTKYRLNEGQHHIAILETNADIGTLRMLRVRYPNDQAFAQQMVRLSVTSPAQWPFA